MSDVLEGWLDDSKAGSGGNAEGKKFFGVVTGMVSPMPDPLALSRIAVSIPCIDELDTIAFARVAAPAAGLFSGHYFTPNPGDSVLVAFEHGDLNSPYIIGSLWHTIFRPPVPISQAQIRTMRTLAGNQIVFAELPPSITLQTPALSPLPIPLPALPIYSTLQLEATGITATAPTIELNCGPVSSISIAPESIKLSVGVSKVELGLTSLKLSFGASHIELGFDGIVIKGAFVMIN